MFRAIEAGKMPTYTQIYRHGSLGSALIDAIDDMIINGRIQPQVGKSALENFDRIMCRSLGDLTRAKLSFKGRLDMYRHCDNIWTFELKDVKMTMNPGKQGRAIEVKRLKIVSYDAESM